jgi:hypothetical protein
MRNLIIAAFLVLALGAAACDDEPTDMNPDGGMMMMNNDSGMQMEECDPNEGPAHVQLLNAPVAAGVEVIMKTPQHPGEPGPNGLP